MAGTYMVASQTHGAGVAPLGPAFVALSHGDVRHGTIACAYAAAYASSVGVERTGRHGKAAEPRIYDA